MIQKSELVSIFAIISTTLTLSSCKLNEKKSDKVTRTTQALARLTLIQGKLENLITTAQEKKEAKDAVKAQVDELIKAEIARIGEESRVAEEKREETAKKARIAEDNRIAKPRKSTAARALKNLRMKNTNASILPG
ncbi:hypothetical protein C0030_004050 [Candidatus Liberibacter solanacearum]|uniref:Lipoprotein n=1 Tax=Candidatus Liberibacter solanacearum TaxID=556287 RepID=A0A3R7TJ16_9HYPH|nr:hypothetical protein [Candidatus Liberibacter solanacearum]RPD37116.1 hypothetical protein C0030_004050 [Candidatus Liberibacter solanacearum]